MLSSLSPRMYSHCSSHSLSLVLFVLQCALLWLFVRIEKYIFYCSTIYWLIPSQLYPICAFSKVNGVPLPDLLFGTTHPAHSAGETGKVLSQYRCVCVLSTFRVHLFTRFSLSSPFYFEPIRSSARRRHPFPRNRRAKLDPQSRQLLILSREFSDPHSTCPKLLPPAVIFFV